MQLGFFLEKGLTSATVKHFNKKKNLCHISSRQQSFRVKKSFTWKEVKWGEKSWCQSIEIYFFRPFYFFCTLVLPLRSFDSITLRKLTFFHFYRFDCLLYNKITCSTRNRIFFTSRKIAYTLMLYFLHSRASSAYKKSWY